MNQPDQTNQPFVRIMRVIFEVTHEEIACEDCYDQIDYYVDMLRAGRDPGEVLPKVKAHLSICAGCDEEFKALISILQAHIDSTENQKPDSQQ